jgi:hypothetical protein
MTRDEALTAIADQVREMTEPRSHIEPIHEDNGYGKQRLRRIWPTAQPSLLDQLQETAHMGLKVSGGGPLGGKPSSRPPGCFDALNALAYIGGRATSWASAYGVAHSTPTDNVRAMVSIASVVDGPTLARLAGEVSYWHRTAAAASGWSERPYSPHVPCPTCGRFGTLRLNIEARAGYCTNRERLRDGSMACGSAWAPGEAGPLFDYIRSHLNGVAA